MIFNEHNAVKTRSTLRCSRLLKLCFRYFDVETFKILYKGMVLLHRENAHVVPYQALKNHRLAMENIQRRKTRFSETLIPNSYHERLKLLRIRTLEYKRERGRLIAIYKILNNLCEQTVSQGLLQSNLIFCYLFDAYIYMILLSKTRRDSILVDTPKPRQLLYECPKNKNVHLNFVSKMFLPITQKFIIRDFLTKALTL